MNLPLQLFVIITVSLVYLAEEASGWVTFQPELSPLTRGIISLGTHGLLLILAFGVVAIARRRLDRTGGWRAVALAERTVQVSMWLAVVVHAANIILFDWVGLVRETLGEWIFLDEFVALTPPLITMPFLWWVQYPINRRIREASLIRRLDEGAPVYPIWSRGQFVFAQVRLHYGMMLVPILLIMAWGETFPAIWPEDALPFSSAIVEQVALVLGTACVFLLSPLLMRFLWDTKPLATGELRQRLEQMCAQHRVRVRQLLIWNTDGGMINGAVMGMLAPVRYILLTDALLDSMTTSQIEAVMAHELGHIRKHHMPWLVLCLIAVFSVVGAGLSFAAEWYIRSENGGVLPREMAVVPTWIEPAVIVGTFVLSLLAFGWISRRIERQADAFAVQHLSGMSTTARPRRVPITPEAVETMSNALQVVAELNHISPDSKSWRHGSINWRREHLASLTQSPGGTLAIDRLMNRVCVAAVLGLIATAGLALHEMRPDLFFWN